MGYTAWDLEAVPELYHMFDHITGQPRFRDNSNLEEIKKTDWICDKQKL
jgi:hypothetical protein